MKARSVARQLAFLMLYQAKEVQQLKHQPFEEFQTMLLHTVRTLSDLALEPIETAGHQVTDIINMLEDYELRHPDNAKIGFDDDPKPVPVPTTQEFRETLFKLLSAIEHLYDALELPELKTLGMREDVQNYGRMLIKRFCEHQSHIDAVIDAATPGWALDRIQKPDLFLLRLATTELMFVKTVEIATIIDETLELAKRYTDEESVKFIHGTLGEIDSLLKTKPDLQELLETIAKSNDVLIDPLNSELDRVDPILETETVVTTSASESAS